MTNKEFQKRLLEILPDLKPTPAYVCPQGCQPTKAAVRLCLHGHFITKKMPNIHQPIIDDIKRKAGL